MAIKLWNGWRVYYDGKVKVCESPVEVWEMFNWDIENDPKAKECATEITRQMMMFGHLDLTKMAHGKSLVLDVIPVSDDYEIEWEESENE